MVREDLVEKVTFDHLLEKPSEIVTECHDHRQIEKQIKGSEWGKTLACYRNRKKASVFSVCEGGRFEG